MGSRAAPGASGNRTALWLTVDRAVRALVLALTHIVLAPLLGPESYGWYSFVLAASAIGIAVSALGLDAGFSLRRLLGSEPRGMLNTLLRLRACGAAGVAGLGLVAAALLAAAGSGHALFVALCIPIVLASLVDVVEPYLQLRGALGRLVRVRIAVITAGLAGKVAVAATAGSAEAVVAVWCVEALILAGLSLRLVRADITAARPATPPREVLALSWPLLASGVMIAMYTRVDQLLLQWVLGASDLGYYAAALRIVEFGFVLQQIAIVAALPAFHRSVDDGGRRAALHLAARGARIAWLGGLAAALGLNLAAGPLVALLYGASYEPAAPVLALLAWALPVILVAAVRSIWIYLYDLSRVALVQNALAAAASLALNVGLALSAPSLEGFAGVYVLACLLAWLLSGLLFTALRDVTLVMLWPISRTSLDAAHRNR